MAEAWVPSLLPYLVRWWTLSEREATWRKQVTKDMSFGRLYQVPFRLAHFQLTRGKMPLHTFLLPGGFLCPRLQATVTANHGIRPLKQWAKRSSPFNCFSWALTTVAGDVLTHCPGSRWDCQSCNRAIGRASAFPLNCLSYQLAVADRACCWGPLWIHSSTAFN